MGTTERDTVYYPDPDEVDQPNVYLATMAQSISDGIGARLRQQEVAVGLKAGLSSQLLLDNNLQIVPFVVNNATANFAQGMTISGGMVTIQTAGMYLVTVSMGLTTVAGDSIVPVLYKNATPFASSEVPSAIDKYAVGQVTSVINCVPGDTIHARARNGKTGAKTLTSPADTLNYISIAMEM